eukprot:CAMPEP_0181451242 /NCGR_PEP_ID=MMETSP1110-20121109/28589_1 /TAXON_ID=174948 /ORGANISM="Symbiodinium sp., Strain CCMP421" /LENGTH=144 /DNA_ID=CAMNT_0023575485 /DNA_START=44 /DNA_END=478 /DNA_ORIENTATION=-
MLEVGDEVVIKATGKAGVATDANGHACKIGDFWYHADELEVKPKQSFCPPMRCGGAPPQKPGGGHQVAGGWTESREPSENDMAVWVTVTSEVDTSLASMGTPCKVSSQVVAGMKYRFDFEDGSQVTVVTVPWMNKTEVLNVARG